jgi:hypothetical protein
MVECFDMFASVAYSIVSEDSVRNKQQVNCTYSIQKRIDSVRKQNKKRESNFLSPNPQLVRPKIYLLGSGLMVHSRFGDGKYIAAPTSVEAYGNSHGNHTAATTSQGVWYP